MHTKYCTCFRESSMPKSQAVKYRFVNGFISNRPSHIRTSTWALSVNTGVGPLYNVLKLDFYYEEWAWPGLNSWPLGHIIFNIMLLTYYHECINLLGENQSMILCLAYTFSKNSFNLKLVSMLLVNIRTFFWTNSNFNIARM
jgi:hypothetical protein